MKDKALQMDPFLEEYASLRALELSSETEARVEAPELDEETGQNLTGGADFTHVSYCMSDSDIQYDTVASV